MEISLKIRNKTTIWPNFLGGSEVKASACNAGDLGSIPGSGRSPGEGNGNPLQHSYLENPMDGGAWWASVHGVAKSRTRLSDFTFTTQQPLLKLLLCTMPHSTSGFNLLWGSWPKVQQWQCTCVDPLSWQLWEELTHNPDVLATSWPMGVLMQTSLFSGLSQGVEGSSWKQTVSHLASLMSSWPP